MTKSEYKTWLAIDEAKHQCQLIANQLAIDIRILAAYIDEAFWERDKEDEQTGRTKRTGRL